MTDETIETIEIAPDLLGARFDVAFDDLGLSRAASADDGRTLTGYVVPWGRPAFVHRPIRGYESFLRGALSKTIADQLDGGRTIPLFGLHRDDKPVAKLVSSHDDEFGQHVVFRMFTGPSAKEAAEMIHEKVWTGLSIGGLGIPSRTKVTRQNSETRIERAEVKLDHIGLVRPNGALMGGGAAYEGAGVLALRSAETLGITDDDDPDTIAELIRAYRDGRVTIRPEVSRPIDSLVIPGGDAAKAIAAARLAS